MPLLTNGVASKRFAKLPEIFDDYVQVESDWYTLAVSPHGEEAYLARQ
jgi:hypothetical protein